ncbi:MAG: hypothetical protein OXE99_14815 [Cellvibrionales bacterium]|nr:hypothetical protein [Cellvibrionales bacterium]
MTRYTQQFSLLLFFSVLASMVQSQVIVETVEEVYRPATVTEVTTYETTVQHNKISQQGLIMLGLVAVGAALIFGSMVYISARSDDGETSNNRRRTDVGAALAGGVGAGLVLGGVLGSADGNDTSVVRKTTRTIVPGPSPAGTVTRRTTTRTYY